MLPRWTVAMEPFQVSLNQVNFEEQELGGETLDAFSNIFSHDAPDFEDPNSNGVPVTARRYNPPASHHPDSKLIFQFSAKISKMIF